MATFSNKVAIGICDRCNFKYKNSELRADGNTPGLRVCESCWDTKDPWRLPPIRPDAIALKYPRPDVSLAPNAPPVSIDWDTSGLNWDSGLTWDETV